MQHINIGGKDVFVVEAHHEILSAWATIRKDLQAAPILITFDHHTDLHKAFLRDCYQEYGEERFEQSIEMHANNQSRLIKYDDPASVLGAVSRLRYDEHIDCARRAGLIGKVYLSLGTSDGFYQGQPWVSVFYDRCVPSCRKRIHDGPCLRKLADEVISDRILAPRIKRIESLEGCRLNELPFIVDVDLDLFRTTKSVDPSNVQTFHRLLRSSLAVTIARESGCVQSGKLPGEQIDADFLQEGVIRQINRAQNQVIA
jgi:hypothetical protein